MEYKIIKDFDNYKIYENSDIYNITTTKQLKPTWSKNYCSVKLFNGETKHYKLLSKLVYETFSGDILNKDESVIFKDQVFLYFH